MKYYLFISAIFFFGACKTDFSGEGKQKQTVERAIFIQILKEMSMLEAYVQDTYGDIHDYASLMQNSGKAILRKYNVTPEAFEQTMDFYGTRQNELHLIYAQILDSLNKEQSELPEVSLHSSDTIHKPFFKHFPGIPN